MKKLKPQVLKYGDYRFMKKFAIIGVGAYIAPRHLEAIKSTNNMVVSALDPHDSVGIIDSYFPDAYYFSEFERFDRHIYKLSLNKKTKIDYLSICSPNYLHDSHIRFGLRSGINTICEKPIVLNPWNLDGLLDLENNTGCKVNTILQLRLHQSIIDLLNRINNMKLKKKLDVDLTYITSRGNWYNRSWKGDLKKSGGIATNIGIHFFDMLHYIFGKLVMSKKHLDKDTKQGGILELEKANVRWFLSIDNNDIPDELRKEGKTTYRSITVDNEEIEFSDGFKDLHIKSYEEIFKGNGFGIEENRDAIETVSLIRNSKVSPLLDDYHPFLKNLKST